MDRESVSRKLNPIVQDIFEDDNLQISDAMTAADVEGWDSLSHINLIVAVEKAFHIKFTTGEVRGLQNVGDFVTLIAKKTP